MQRQFQNSQHTAIVSDLHLCEAEPVNPKYPLWKKFKTRQFFFDDVFVNFLNHIQEKAHGQPVELILNGDIFDFDSVMARPEKPAFRFHWLEEMRGLYPRPERSKFKIQIILKHHHVWVQGLKEFVKKGNKAVFVIGNHDLELHFPDVQNEILAALDLDPEASQRVRFCEWFYISNQDTLIEHGNQYDPYCMCEDPVNPFIQGYNYKSIRLPFGNLACRYILNGMGFFNPHVESNFIMSLQEYVKFFTKYIWRAQPFLIWDWFFGAMATLMVALSDRLLTPIKDPLKIEDKVNSISEKSNAEPRMVRELKELFVPSATTNPFLIARELWLDRAFLLFIGFLAVFELMILTKQFFDLSIFWALIPLVLLLPFFLFYSKSVTSLVSSFKEPDERILAMASAITKVNRIVYGHTHLIRHEMIGSVEHLNSGCWSPAFLDVECTRALDQKTYVWLRPGLHQQRQAELFIYDGEKSLEAFGIHSKNRNLKKTGTHS
jgi:UDP-2,3-diacylglucosamine pyrophosphatase LpxH